MTAVSLDGVGKRFQQTVEQPMLLKRLLGLQRRRQAHDLWALRDVSFSLERGETLGIIGRNGSGKTTLLRLLSGVSGPTEGRLRVVGSIAPLIGVGVGFNPELTGRENVFVNGQLLGMSEAEVRRKFDAIVDFSEMSEFIDTPVKYYSSGMFLRLAFSVAVHAEPDIFVVDEVLAVGDFGFQVKCHERMREVQANGTTIVIVTHNLELLHLMAPRAILLSHGRVAFDGPVEEALGAYQDVMQQEDAALAGRAAAAQLEGGGQAYVGGADVHVELVDDDGLPARHFATGDEIRVRVRATFANDVTDPLIGLMVSRIGLGALFSMHTFPGDYSGVHGPDRPLEAEVVLSNHLLTNAYNVQAGVLRNTDAAVIGMSRAESFHVTSPLQLGGMVDLQPRVEVEGEHIPLRAVERLGVGVTGRRREAGERVQTGH